MNPTEEVDCEFGCTSDLGVHVQCPTHNPIDTVLHDSYLTIEEPKRLELRTANTTEALRNRVLAAGNGHGEYKIEDRYYTSF